MTMPLNIPDQQLINSYLDGNDKAMEELLHRHKDKLYSAIYYLVKDTHVAEDILQDTWMKAINTLRAGNYSEEGKFFPWVMRIAHNLCIDHFRRAKRVPVFHSTSAEAEAEDGFTIFNILKANDDAPDVMIHKRQACAYVRELINELPEEQRQTLVLRHYADMSFKEIAGIMDVSINTALGRMRYAILNMRKKIQQRGLVL